MTTPPPQPMAIGGQFEYARKTFAYNRQRSATGTSGSVTTMGWIPARTKKIIQRTTPSATADARYS